LTISYRGKSFDNDNVEIVKISGKYDLAVIRLKNFKVGEFFKIEEPRTIDTTSRKVIANPFGSLNHSVEGALTYKGLRSSTGLKVEGGVTPFSTDINVYSTDITGVEGMSGSPVVYKKTGAVIGVFSGSAANARTFGWAIPVRYLSNIKEEPKAISDVKWPKLSLYKSNFIGRTQSLRLTEDGRQKKVWADKYTDSFGKYVEASKATLKDLEEFKGITHEINEVLDGMKSRLYLLCRNNFENIDTVMLLDVVNRSRKLTMQLIPSYQKSLDDLLKNLRTNKEVNSDINFVLEEIIVKLRTVSTVADRLEKGRREQIKNYLDELFSQKMELLKRQSFDSLQRELVSLGERMTKYTSRLESKLGFDWNDKQNRYKNLAKFFKRNFEDLPSIFSGLDYTTNELYQNYKRQVAEQSVFFDNLSSMFYLLVYDVN